VNARTSLRLAANVTNHASALAVTSPLRWRAPDPMPIPASIAERIETFRRNLDSYLSPDYKETELRREFLDPFFAALGWDVFNHAGHAEAYKDVVHEDSLKIGGDTRAPDYSFRIGGTRKFFVEAKKPSVRIKDDPEPARQLRRYSWSAKLPLGIVTDFHELAIYDTRVRPQEKDKPATARIFYCTFDDYPEKWDEIAGIFAKDSVLKGSFDKYAGTHRGKRGTSAFDDDFLADMERWRELLARNLALRNPDLTQRDLNFAVQRVLDRIIFLRIAEDRGIEKFGQLQALTAGPGIYPRLGEIFERADFRYNSGLFHFANEKGRDEAPDKLTLGLKLDDAALREIISSLYYPKSPYAFAVIPADILGHVYEQFLGKVIHLTAGHRAVVEEKPEVRKAGGVYYTPTYIVDYIVRQTVGPMVEGKSPKQVEKLKVLDPACGSGSFLLGAYDFLLDWHLRYYLDHDPAAWAKKKQPPIYETAPNAHGIGHGSGNWQLTTAERKRILVNHLHGVDIDAQAVEVTKLSLLLKVLEGEARELQGKQLDFHRVLPDLGNNIKCGNSLIGSDFYAQPDLPTLDDEARYKINAFDWDVEFKPIMDGGGFDAVIGNPPYIPLELLREEERTYIRHRYPELQRKFDSSVAFMLGFLPRLAMDGRLGYIAPQTWETGENYTDFRLRLLSDFGIQTVINLPFDVFKDAYVDTGVFVFTRERTSSYGLCVMPKSGGVSDLSAVRLTSVPVSEIGKPDFQLVLNPGARRIMRRLTSRVAFTTLGEITISTQGLAGNRFLISASKSPSATIPFLEKGQARRYSLEIASVAYTSLDDKRALARFYKGEPKLLIRRVISRQDRLLVAYTDRELVFKKDINPFIVIVPGWQPKFLLGILNSKFVSWLYLNSSAIATKDDFRQTTLAELRRIPLPTVSLGNNIHDAIVTHVERMLKLHEQFATAKSPQVQTHLSRDIAAVDRGIDQLVYQLYGLTDEEIGIIENATAPVSGATADLAETGSPTPPPPATYNAQAEAAAAHHHFLAKEDPNQKT